VESNSDRRGRECIVPVSRGKSSIQSLLEQNFQVNGPKLFNSLPKNIRDTTIDDFKQKFAKFWLSCQIIPKFPTFTSLASYLHPFLSI
jgi:hypothetical protein